MDEDGDFSESGENPFSRCNADSVCFHPGVALYIDEIQGQKCRCCLMGLNSIALSESSDARFRSDSGKKRAETLLELISRNLLEISVDYYVEPTYSTK